MNRQSALDFAKSEIRENIARISKKYGVIPCGAVSNTAGTFSFVPKGIVPTPEMVLELEIALSEVKLRLYLQAAHDYGSSPILNSLITHIRRELATLESSLIFCKSSDGQTELLEGYKP